VKVPGWFQSISLSFQVLHPRAGGSAGAGRFHVVAEQQQARADDAGDAREQLL